MKHFSDDEILRYVRNELKEADRAAFEGHLYSCDPCLDSYLQVVENEAANLPVMADESDFTERVMVDVGVYKKTKEKEQATPKIKRFYHQVVFHYFLAAAATILLMMSGVFQSLTKYTDTVQSPQIAEKAPSVTEGIIDKTFNWMDSLEKKNEEVKTK